MRSEEEVSRAIDTYADLVRRLCLVRLKNRDTVYLHYYEGYSAPEIGALLGRNTNTVYTLLNRARAMLREKLGGDEDG